MFTAGLSVFHLVPLLLKIVVGAVALTLACLWKSQKGKLLFCFFVGTAFLAGPLLDLGLYLLFLSPAYQNGFGNSSSLMAFMQWIACAKFLFEFVALVLLIVYAAVRYGAVDSKNEPTSDPDQASAVAYGRRWDTHLPASKLIEIARRREWAHAIDCSPAVLFFILFAYIFGSTLFDNNWRTRDLRAFVWALSAFATLSFLAYLLMKDCIGGVSIGKWFTGCRVVDAASGMPASGPQTMLRNAIFLVFPLGSFIELAVVNFRPDRKRLGDLWAGTMVVQGPAQIVDGVRVQEEAAAEKPEQAPKKHPLDD